MSNFERWLQHRLNLNGAHPPLVEDGVVGRLTYAALVEYQRRVGLYPSGVADAKTVSMLRISNTTHDVAGEGPEAPRVVPPWISLARTKMGLTETRDKAELMRFLKSDGNTLGDPSKLPWCGDFVETCIAVALPKEPTITNPYWALNWLKFGRPIPENQFYLGAVAVFKREGGGHVAFVVGQDANYVHTLGGNQSNSVSISRMAKDRLQGFRWPSTYPTPTIDMLLARTTIDATITTNEA